MGYSEKSWDKSGTNEGVARGIATDSISITCSVSSGWDKSGAEKGVNRGVMGDGICGSFCGCTRPVDD